MDAKHAREMASLVTSKTNERQFDDAMLSIQRAVSKGALHVTVYDDLSNATRSKLSSLGYMVGASTLGREGYMTLIKW